nr:hypothetical protein [Micromonospora veneta]
MTQIEINPGQLTNAARGLEEFVAPDLTEAARRIADSYRLDPPGLGALLSFAEGYYNSVADYQLRNLETAAEVVRAVAGGLRQTVANYHAAEQANVELLLAPAAADPDGYLGGLSDAGFPRLFTDPLGGIDGLGDGAAEALTVASQTMFVGLGVATAAMAPDYLPAPITAAAMVANGFSVIEAARELGAVAATLEGSVIKKFDEYATGATAGWVDASVVEYRDIVATAHRTCGRSRSPGIPPDRGRGSSVDERFRGPDPAGHAAGAAAAGRVRAAPHPARRGGGRGDRRGRPRHRPGRCRWPGTRPGNQPARDAAEQPHPAGGDPRRHPRRDRELDRGGPGGDRPPAGRPEQLLRDFGVGPELKATMAQFSQRAADIEQNPSALRRDLAG